MTQAPRLIATAPPATFDALRQQIRQRFAGLSPHLQRIARASLEEPNAIALSTTQVIAGQLGVQPSTLIRFAKEFGFAGFSDLQKVFRQRLIEGEAAVRDRVSEAAADTAPDIDALVAAGLSAQRAALDRLEETLDRAALDEAVRALRGARHVYVAGLRRSRPIADYLHYGLIRKERAASLLDFAGGMAGPQIATMDKADLLIAIAFPPYSGPVVDAVMDAHVSGKRILALTDGPESPLVRYSDIALTVEAGAQSSLQPIGGPVAVAQMLIASVG